MALKSRQLDADNDTGDIWPNTEVRSRMRREVTYNKMHVRVNHSENNALLTVLHQPEQRYR